MHVNEDGRVSGSLNRARLLELFQGTGDPEMKAYYRDLLGDSEEGDAADAWDAPEPEPEDLSKLKKAELVEKATEAGLEDAESLTKAEIVQLLGEN
jgi:hypothetical protein